MSTIFAMPAGPVPAGPAGAGTAGAGGAGTVAGTEPYPWPWDGRFAARRCALLVIGDGAPIGDPSVASAVRELRDRALAAGVLVIQVVTGRRARGSRSGDSGSGDSGSGDSGGGPGVAGAGVAGAGVTGLAWPFVLAAGWDGFYGSPLDDVLRSAGRDQLLLTGRLLETGVHSTLRSANDRGFECLTIGDACEIGSAETGRGGLSSITMSGGIFGAIGTSAAVLALLGACDQITRPSTEGT